MDLAVTVYAVAVILAAAVVRGFSGFGFSLLAISALALVVPPVEVIASIFLMELAASLHLLPGVWRAINWRAVTQLGAGTLLATPLGVWLLVNVPAAPMKIALAGLVLAVVVLLWRGFALRAEPTAAATVATGAAVGLLNGAFGIGGPPAILFFFSSPAGAKAGRASLIAYFLVVDVIGLGTQMAQGLLTTRHFVQAALFLPPLLLGVWLGAHAFKQVDAEAFRKLVLLLLAFMALAIGAQGLLGV